MLVRLLEVRSKQEQNQRFPVGLRYLVTVPYVQQGKEAELVQKALRLEKDRFLFPMASLVAAEYSFDFFHLHLIFRSVRLHGYYQPQYLVVLAVVLRFRSEVFLKI